MSKTRRITKRRFVITWSAVVGVIVVAVVVVSTLAFGTYRTVLDGYFRPAVERSDTLTNATIALTEELESEGIVLLKNDEGALPLAEDGRRVNVFGWSATNPVYGGTGSGAVNTALATSFLGGLEAAGIEYNTEITDFYTAFRTDRPAIQIRAQDWTVPEPSMAEYDAAGIFESARAFSDTAVVMISRSGGEGADLSRSLGGSADDIAEQELPDGRVVDVGSAGSEYADDIDAAKHYLEISNRERAMLERVTAEFENVVVLLNTGNVFEMGWINELDVDAAAIGGPGESGFLAVGKMLTGEVNPSGRTVDTWLYDLFDDPTATNFGAFTFTGSENVDTGDVPIEWSGDPSTAPGFQFVNYAEGIYVGYRYFETYYLGNETGYAGTVQFPFGYGLSYSTFTQEMTDPQVSGTTVSVEVTVTNTGDVAGKDVVQLYSTPPYTEGGIEKSAKNLVDFAKTAVLEPGDSETVMLELDLEDLASYDYQGAGAWVLESGDYTLSIGENAHDAFDSGVLTQAETITYDGENKRSSDVEAATNRFEDALGEVTVLSRAKSFANRDEALVQAVNREMTEAEQAAVYVQLPEVEGAEMPTTGADNGLSLEDVVGLDYDDPTWDQLLDQVTVEEMKNVITYGGFQTEPVESVGKPGTFDIDGPQGLSSFMGASVRAGAYTTEMVVASTWNVDLAYRFGQSVGYEALELGVSGWYAPGMNLHRNAFAGRNFEYFGEDPYLSAQMSAADVRGAAESGLYTYVKHFVVNDQETYRNSRLTTWVDEQALRELYFPPFEASVKEGGTTAVMSSFNYLGGIWAGGHPALLQDVLRGEWGFRGMVVSDYFGSYGYMDGDQAMANGTDMMLSTLGMFGAMPDQSDDASGVTQLRTATKNILYTVANSSTMYSADERDEKLAAIGGEYSGPSGFNKLAYDMGLETWVLTAYIVLGVIVLGVLALVYFKVRKYRKLFPASAEAASGS